MDIMFNKIQIKFQIDVNNNKILKTKWEDDKKKKGWMSLVVHSNVEPKLIRMALHKRLEKIQPPPTTNGIVLVIVDGLMHGATNEPMTSMLKD